MGTYETLTLTLFLSFLSLWHAHSLFCLCMCVCVRKSSRVDTVFKQMRNRVLFDGEKNRFTTRLTYYPITHMNYPFARQNSTIKSCQLCLSVSYVCVCVCVCECVCVWEKERERGRTILTRGTLYTVSNNVFVLFGAHYVQCTVNWNDFGFLGNFFSFKKSYFFTFHCFSMSSFLPYK